MSYTEEEYYIEDDCDSAYEDGQWSLGAEKIEAEHMPGLSSLGTESFITLTASEVLDNMRKGMEKANEILGLAPDAALLVLRHLGWVMDDAVLEKYLSDMERINKELNITDICHTKDSSGKENVLLLQNDKPLECPICGDEIPIGKAVAIPRCQHFFCVDCFVANLHFALKHDSDLFNKRCPKKKCCSIVGLGVFEELLPSKEYVQVQQRVIRDYLRNNPHMRCCPNKASCEGVLHVMKLRESGPDVCCSICGLEFCFKCLQPPHAPATCQMMKRWIEVLEKNEPTLALIQEKTKGCPKCLVRTEKNHGCNHMTCSCCRHEYCWVCLGPWSEHNRNYYNCDKREPENNKNGDQMLFLNCFTRWENHKESISLEKETLQKVLQNIRNETQNHKGAQMHGNSLNIVLETQRVLHECRLILMNGYIALYFGGLSNTSFHYRLQQLELRTEETSALIHLLPNLENVDELKSCLAQAVHWCSVLRKEGLD
ncbi:IBR domain [Trypanosoma melophagium]|uniref:IBR domain n=1 Tax=Trypanosoma melophagium TaxID=715481 RepID=UPI00351A4BD8|nr:IBR domain [Trypanosoma melophagium]